MRPLELEDLVPIRPWRKFPPLLPLSVDLIPAINFGTVSDDHSYHRYYGFGGEVIQRLKQRMYNEQFTL